MDVRHKKKLIVLRYILKWDKYNAAKMINKKPYENDENRTFLQVWNEIFQKINHIYQNLLWEFIMLMHAFDIS